MQFLSLVQPNLNSPLALQFNILCGSCLTFCLLSDLIEVKTEDIKQENLELLQTNAQLIDQLKMVQNERLSGTPPSHFSQLQKPTDKEIELAANIQNNLVEMVGQVKPNQILPEAAIRAVMGIKTPLPNMTLVTPRGNQSSPMDVE